MSLGEKIKNDFKEALKQKEQKRLSVLKLLSAAIINEQIKLGKKDEGLSEEETLKVVKAEAKKRKDSVEAFTKAGRNEMANEEKEELAILGTYLPEEMSDEELSKIVDKAVKESGAESMKDFGKAMKACMDKAKGSANGDRVSEMVKKLLG